MEEDEVDHCDEEVVGEEDETRIPTKSDDQQMPLTLQSTFKFYSTQQLIDEAGLFTWTCKELYAVGVQACHQS